MYAFAGHGWGRCHDVQIHGDDGIDRVDQRDGVCATIKCRTGRGSDIMVPMAIPSFGGMLIQVMTMFVVPVLYSMWREKQVRGNILKNT